MQVVYSSQEDDLSRIGARSEGDYQKLARNPLLEMRALSEMNPNTNITLCVTSCDRHDLLRSTLDSFFAYADIKPQQILVYEDSQKGMPEFMRAWEYQRRQPLVWMSDGVRKGQAYACARLISEVKHDWVMWLEDDWLFQQGSGAFVEQSRELLRKNPEVIKVSLRGDTGWHPLKQDPRGYKVAEPYWRGVWGGWAWNPGLSRAEDVKALLPHLAAQIGQGGLKHEEALSKRLLDEGRRIADLGRPVVSHIGGGRSRAIEKLPPLPKILIAVPTCFEFDYESHAISNPEGFHVNGANEQTKAVRETWASDFKGYPTVDFKFFYGQPNDKGIIKRITGRVHTTPAADEVFLDCGDGYDSLIQKTIGVCQYAVRHGYKYVAKFDTDTFVYAERLLLEIMQNAFDYAGFRHANVASGGPGYLLSNKASDIISRETQPQHPYAEDVHVARTLAKHGISPLMLQGHHSGMSAHFFFGKAEKFDPAMIPDGIVTAHAVFPEVMRRWHTWLKKNEKSKAA